MLQDVIVRGIGVNRNRPRVFLDMPALERAAFMPGEAYRLRIDPETTSVVLELSPEGDRVVSSKYKGARRVPVVDLSSFRVLSIFSAFQRIRVIFMRGRVTITPLASDLAKRERIERLATKLESGEPLRTASLFHGAGLMNLAAHQGLHEAGIPASTALINEIDEECADQSRRKNPVWNEHTKGMVMPMQEVLQDPWVLARIPKVEVVDLSPPCSGASRAGIAKNKLECMEAHPTIGHMIVPALAMLNVLQPAVVVLECVEGYKSTGSAHIARSVLRDMGYSTQELVLNAANFGALEARVRWFMIAATEGLSLDMTDLKDATWNGQGCLGDVLESIDDEDPRWMPMQYLRDKEVRDAAKGSNFKMQVIHPEDSKIPCLRRGYFKGGSVDPVLAHPSKPGMLRKLTAREHAAAKGFCASLVEGLSESKAHPMLGQGVAAQVVAAIFKRVGEGLKAFHESKSTQLSNVNTYSLKGTG